MSIRVLLFGPEAAALGRDHILVALEPGDNCAALLERLHADFPALRPSLAAARLAVNSEFAPPDHPVRAGDEVALIGMVSGG